MNGQGKRPSIKFSILLELSRVAWPSLVNNFTRFHYWLVGPFLGGRELDLVTFGFENLIVETNLKGMVTIREKKKIEGH